jgi:probable rRNA maturation factor
MPTIPTTADAETSPDPEPDSPREIIVAAPGWDDAPFRSGEAADCAEAAISAAAAELALGPDIGLALLLADDAALRQLNADHRGKDQPTNVLSFPAFDPDDLPDAGHIGDIAVALETILAESLDAGRPPLHHLAHMVVHGVLHLAGYDHATDAEADAMEAIEVRALARMGVPNPYQDGARAP